MAVSWILVLNAGSSSLKAAAFGLGGARLAQAKLEETDVAGLDSIALYGVAERLAEAARPAVLNADPSAVGHRIVHGLDRRAPGPLDAEARAAADSACAFAPLHNPPALHVADLAARLWPDAAPYACFDTAFHAANPPLETTLPLPADWRAAGLRRYGFHGLSYASLVRRFEGVTGAPLPRRLLAMHLGAGASAAAILDGVGVASSMGFSPMDGLIMATRSGALDPGVIFHLQRQGLSAEEVERRLNRESGLTGLSGTGDMRALAARDDPEATLAVELYVQSAARHGAGLICALGGLDGIVFAGGVGENAPQVREGIVAALGWAGASPDRAWVVPTDEEGEIAAATLSLMREAAP